jgi:hypothetical protein
MFLNVLEKTFRGVTLPVTGQRVNIGQGAVKPWEKPVSNDG